MALDITMDFSDVDQGQNIIVVARLEVFDPCHAAHVLQMVHSEVWCQGALSWPNWWLDTVDTPSV